MMQVLILLLFSAFIWFAVRTLKGIDRNQSEMFRRLNYLEKDFYTLRGEHKAHHGVNGDGD